MTSPYKRIKDYDNTLWGDGSPVVVEKMRLSFNKNYGVNVLQITFRNVSKLSMYGLSIELVLKSEDGRSIHKVVTFNYYAMEVPCGKTFGSEEDIVVEPEAAIFDITVTGADLAGGIRFFDKIKLEKMPPGQPLEFLGDYQERYENKLRLKYPKIQPVVCFEDRKIYWRCVCDRIWPEEIETCTACRAKKEVLMGILPEIRKEEKEERERLAAEKKKAEEEQARLEEEERVKEEEERARKEAEAAEQAAREAAEQERIRREKELEEQLRKQKQKKLLRILAGVAVFTLVVGITLWFKSRHVSRPAQIEDTQATNSEEYQEDATREVPALAAEETSSAAVITRETQAATEPVREELPVPFICSAAEMDAETEKVLWRLFGVESGELSGLEKRTVSTGIAHTYLDDTIGAENVEKNAYSAILVIPKEDGDLNVTTYNISYYTPEEYAGELKKLGYEHADVIVAAPETASGSTAMLGLMLESNRRKNEVGMPIGIARAKGGINIRSGEGMEYPIYTTVAPGTELEVLEILDSGWMKVLWPAAEDGVAYSSNAENRYYEFIPY